MRDHRLAVGLGVLALQLWGVCFAQETAQLPAQDPVLPAPATAEAVATPTTTVKDWETSVCPEDVRCVIVAEAYLEMHTGPGIGYPVFHVASRGEMVQVLGRRTDWFLVRTSREFEGWVKREQMMTTLEVDGTPTTIKQATRQDYTTRTWEAGYFLGRFGGASLIAIYGSFGFTEHLSLELTVSDAIGNISDSLMGSLGLTHTFAPEWRVSPYVTLGTGVIYSETRATLVQPEDTVDQIGYVGGGARGYLSRRFLGRFEYRRNVIFTSSNENEEIHEWKLGFGFFF